MKNWLVIILSGWLGSLSPTSFGDDAEILRTLQLQAQTSRALVNPLFMNSEEREVAFANFEGLYPTRNIPASQHPILLSENREDLSDLSYTLDGKKYVLGRFLAKQASRGLIVVKQGSVIFEYYAPGHGADIPWVSFSVTKSVTSMLIGAAIKDGYIKSVDEPVTHYLPRLRGTAYEGSTIRDVLQMSSGTGWNEDYADPESDVAKAGGANGLVLVDYLSTLEKVHKAGAVFNYNTGETNLAGEILRSAIGNNASTYLSQKIWQPFGMADNANWMLGGVNGGETGGCCISATLRDYARLGLFAMSGGLLPGGDTVMPDGWMDASTRPSTGSSKYGYLWWLFDETRYAALGIFGQRIFVDPDSELVFAAHSNAPTAVGSEYHRHLDAVTSAISEWARDRK